MKIKATVKNTPGSQDIALETDGKMHSLSISPREGAPGSSVNGGELLFLADLPPGAQREQRVAVDGETQDVAVADELDQVYLSRILLVRQPFQIWSEGVQLRIPADANGPLAQPTDQRQRHVNESCVACSKRW